MLSCFSPYDVHSCGLIFVPCRLGAENAPTRAKRRQKRRLILVQAAPKALLSPVWRPCSNSESPDPIGSVGVMWFYGPPYQGFGSFFSSISGEILMVYEAGHFATSPRIYKAKSRREVARSRSENAKLRSTWTILRSTVAKRSREATSSRLRMFSTCSRSCEDTKLRNEVAKRNRDVAKYSLEIAKLPCEAAKLRSEVARCFREVAKRNCEVAKRCSTVNSQLLGACAVVCALHTDKNKWKTCIF